MTHLQDRIRTEDKYINGAEASGPKLIEPKSKLYSANKVNIPSIFLI